MRIIFGWSNRIFTWSKKTISLTQQNSFVKNLVDRIKTFGY